MIKDKFKLTWRKGKGPGRSEIVHSAAEVLSNVEGFLSVGYWTSLSIRDLSTEVQDSEGSP